jgi:hypothetical protein
MYQIVEFTLELALELTLEMAVEITAIFWEITVALTLEITTKILVLLLQAARCRWDVYQVLSSSENPQKDAQQMTQKTVRKIAQMYWQSM